MDLTNLLNKFIFCIGEQFLLCIYFFAFLSVNLWLYVIKCYLETGPSIFSWCWNFDTAFTLTQFGLTHWIRTLVSKSALLSTTSMYGCSPLCTVGSNSFWSCIFKLINRIFNLYIFQTYSIHTLVSKSALLSTTSIYGCSPHASIALRSRSRANSRVRNI